MWWGGVGQVGWGGLGLGDWEEWVGWGGMGLNSWSGWDGVRWGEVGLGGQMPPAGAQMPPSKAPIRLLQKPPPPNCLG